ncbi:MAG: hypothetical protein MIO92_01950 [Methanosarcinaceae archaeon]|nr:hypothetical protein [Methanosarcinaceae archaeon]
MDEAMCESTGASGVSLTRIKKQGVFSEIGIPLNNSDFIAKSMMANDLVQEGWRMNFVNEEGIIKVKFYRSWEFK